MNKDFRVLTTKEEQQLSKEELKKYYEELRKYILKRKLTNTTPGAKILGPKLKKPVEKVAIKLVELFANIKWSVPNEDGSFDENDKWIYDGLENIPKGPVIFAHTHQGLLDNFVWMPVIKKHSFILHGQEVNKLLLLSECTTGLIFVKKGDKTNNNNAKLDMIRLLLEGYSITYFPEGTWNLSPNKLHLPMSFGIIDIAKKTGVPIIPIVHEYTYDTTTKKENIIKIHSRFGKPIYVSEEDNLIEKLNEYQESISTIRWELIEEKGIFKRENVSTLDYINFLEGNYKNLKLGKLNIEKERDNIFGANNEFYDYFHINDIPYNEKGEFLTTTYKDKENKKIKALNKKNKI